MADLRNIKNRLDAASAKLPPAERAPRLCIVTSEDTPDIREAKLTEAARTGDPILEVAFFEAES
jgi:hypothetical protein